MICPSSLASITDTVEVGIMASLYDDGSNGNCCYVTASRRSGTKNKFFAAHPTRYIPINTQLSFYPMLYTGGEIWLLILRKEYRMRIFGADVIM